MVALAGGLRAAGVAVSTGETLDAVAALAAVGPGDREVVRSALRTTMVKDRAHDAVFDRLFATLFPRWSPARPGGPGAASAEPSSPDALRTALAGALRRGDDAEVTARLDEAVRQWAGLDGPSSSERHHVQRVLRRLDLGALLQLMARHESADAFQRRLDIAEAAERVEEVRRRLEELVAGRRLEVGSPDAEPVDLEDRQILRAGPDEIAALRAAVRPLARRLASRLGHRRRPGRGRLDMRRTIRRSMGSGGVPLDPRLRRRSPTRPDLVVLCDVSGSIAPYAPFALALLHALHGELGHVRSWAFVDGIVEITDLLESAAGVLDARRLLDRRGLVVGDGRSDYARAFGALLAQWTDIVTPKTTVIVVGDARSHDRPAALDQTAELRRNSRRLYWLNPEPRAEWDTGDSAIAAYSVHCTQTFEVSTLRQLSDCVAAIA